MTSLLALVTFCNECLMYVRLHKFKDTSEMERESFHQQETRSVIRVPAAVYIIYLRMHYERVH